MTDYADVHRDRRIGQDVVLFDLELKAVGREYATVNATSKPVDAAIRERASELGGTLGALLME